MRDTSRLTALLLAGTMLGGLWTAPAAAQDQPEGAPASAPQASPAPAPALPAAPAATPSPVAAERVIRSMTVEGSQRLEAGTVLSYTRLRIGSSYTRETLDDALKDLYASELFANVEIRDSGDGALTIVVQENPVINRIVLEGNKRLKDDKIRPEIKMAPRQIYTRSKVRADVARIVELYRRQGRFAAVVDPKLVTLDQNRVDIVYEISEGPKSKVRQVNIIGNEVFSDAQLRGEMATKQKRWFRLFSSGTSYDPDRLAYDQQKLRQFYLTEGYADFRVVSAVAELTSNKQDFIITYVVEEGERYKFGDVAVKSDLRDLSSEGLTRSLRLRKGDWYNAKAVEDTVEQLNQTAGLFGYAFADVQPDFEADKEARTMSITFQIANAPRVYVERIDINGNTLTQDKVVRREFRLQEGDAFNTFQVRRSQDRINSLGFFQERLEVEQKPGSAGDRIVLETNVEEKSTGELSLSAGFSSLERFILSASVTQRNFRGMGQELRTSVDYSSYSKSIQAGFTEPYFLDRNMAVGFDVFRRDLNSFNYYSTDSRNTTYSQVQTGFQLRAGIPITEYLSLGLRYGLSFDNVTLDRFTYYTDSNGNGIRGDSDDDVCDPLQAGRYLCDALGRRTTSTVTYSLVYDAHDNRIRPTRGYGISLTQDFAGLGGNVSYVRSQLQADKYWSLGSGFVFSVSGQGSYIHSFQKSPSASADAVRLVDRFFLGEPQIRGFDIRGVGPRILRKPYLTDDSGNITGVNENRDYWSDDALGGRAMYLFRAELEIPLGAGARDMGLRPSIFLDAGAVFGLRAPTYANGGLIDKIFTYRQCQAPDGTDGSSGSVTQTLDMPCPTGTNEIGLSRQGFKEFYVGDSPKPRVSVGFGVNWNSPFGPFRIDVAKALVSVPGDDTKVVTFNVGTQF